MKKLVFSLAILAAVFSHSFANAQAKYPLLADFGLPSTFGAYNTNSYNATSDVNDESKYYRFEADQMKIYWPIGTGSDVGKYFSAVTTDTGQRLKCNSAHLKVLITKPPLAPYPAKQLWSDFSPVLANLLKTYCGQPNEHLEPYHVNKRGTKLYNNDARIAAHFYYEGLNLDEGEFVISKTIYGDSKTPEIAFGWFVFNRDELANGRLRHLNTYDEKVVAEFSMTSFMKSMHTHEKGFERDGFPDFEFLNALAFSVQIAAYYEEQAVRKKTLFWQLFVRGLSDQSRPHYCEASKNDLERPLACAFYDGD